MELHYETAGSGPPLVLVHGSWVDHHSWDAAFGPLSEAFRVVALDRRGHGLSEPGQPPGSILEDADDVGALIAELELGSAHVAGSSWGGSIALWLAARRPDLVRSVVAHEPPLFDLLDPACWPELDRLRTTLKEIAAQLAAGDHEGGARRYVDEVAYGPHAWRSLGERRRAGFVANAPTYLDQCRDPHQMDLDLAAAAAFEGPVLLTYGDRRPPFFRRIVEVLSEELPTAGTRLLPGAAQDPQVTGPVAYAEVVREFCAPQPARAGASTR